jgi:hypothetical protein
MFRWAALAFFTATFWFFLNDSPAVTKSTGQWNVPPAPQTRDTIPPRQAGFDAQAQAEPAAQPRRTRKARPQLRVSPLYPYRRSHALYPLPYNVAYPGPRGVRHCVNRYVTERRPSGPVVVPQVRCWWTRG